MDVASAQSPFIPAGEIRATFPPEPTRLRVRAGSAGQGRPENRPPAKRVAWRGAVRHPRIETAILAGRDDHRRNAAIW
jgi:hypothetical protein